MSSQPPEPKRILLIKPSSLGDVVHALPVLVALRAAYPQAHIAWLVSTTFAPLLEGHPLLDEVIPFDRRHYGRMLKSRSSMLGFARFVAELRRKRFDLVIDLQGLFRSGLLAYASGAKQRIGFQRRRELAWLFYTQLVKTPPGITHAVDRNLAVARAMGLAVPQQHPAFPLALRDDETDAARGKLAQAAGHELERFIALIPGARWKTKLWSAARLGELIDRLDTHGLSPCLLLGARDDRAFTDEILAACRTTPIDLVGCTTLRELAALIDLSQAVICHDSGPMHIAAALDKPTVAIFGPTDPRRTGPYSPAAHIVGTPIECSPCLQRTCWHHSCMRQLEVETVVRAVQALDLRFPGRAPRVRSLPTLTT